MSNQYRLAKTEISRWYNVNQHFSESNTFLKTLSKCTVPKEAAT